MNVQSIDTLKLFLLNIEYHYSTSPFLVYIVPCCGAVWCSSHTADHNAWSSVRLQHREKIITL